MPAGAARAEERGDGLTRRRLVAAGAAAGAGAALAGAVGTSPAAAAAAQAAAPAAPATTGRAAARSSRAKQRATATAAATLPDAKTVQADGRDLVDHDIFELAALLRAGATTSVELTRAYIARIKKFNGPFEVYGDNGGYNAFVRIDEESALAQAKAADERIAVERRGGTPAPWLCGMPFGFKDSIGVKGFAAQNGTAVAFSGNVANEDAAAVAALRAQGVVCLGITICSAYSSSIIGGFSGNAWDYTRVTGGSSQGSGVAAVARLAAGALGEETGGSIMLPASVNGASAIKPSTGVVPTGGVMPLTPGVDVLGPMMRSGRDAALVLNAMSGVDPRDPQTWQVPRPFPQSPLAPRPGDKPLAGTTIGIPKTDWMGSNNVDPQSRYEAGHLAVFNRVKQELTAMGATVKEFPWVNMNSAAQDPFFQSSANLGGGYSPVTTLAYANRAEYRYIEAIAEFAAHPDRRAQASVLIGQYGLNGSFAAAAARNRSVTVGARMEAEARRRRLVANCMKSLDEHGVDFMLVMSVGGVPSTTTFAPYRSYYQLPNQIGWPMVSFPAGSSSGLPASVSLWGPRFSEPELVQTMIDYQARHPEWHTARPADPWSDTPITRRDKSGTRTKDGRRLTDAEVTQIARNNEDPMASTDATVTQEVLGQ